MDDFSTYTLERPVTEAKKFTFSRVAHAPSSAGVQMGKVENGLLECTFTPEVKGDRTIFVKSITGETFMIKISGVGI